MNLASFGWIKGPLALLAVLSCLSLQAQLPNPLEPINWTTGTATTPGTSLVIGSDGGVYKSSGASGWNADAISTQAIVGDGEVEFTSPLGHRALIGLLPSDTSNLSTDADYAIYLNTTNVAQVYENGDDVFTFPVNRTATTVYTIRRTGTRIDYLADGVVQYTSTVPSKGLLYADATFHLLNHQISMAKIAMGDVDEDGMSDVWELSWLPAGSDMDDVENFLHGDGATGTYDNDGLTNLQEFQMGLCPVEADTDGDGMPDGWEVENGLLPLDPVDAFSDKDMDRVPNLWEYAHGTEADNAMDYRLPDAVVDASLPADIPPTQFRTFQAAYDSLPSTPGYRALVAVARGTYVARLDPGDTPKKVAWQGYQSNADKNSGKEGIILKAPAWDAESPVQGMTFNDDTWFENFILDGGFTDLRSPAVSFIPHASVAAEVPEMRMVNCIVRNWRSTYQGEPFGPGAVLNKGGDLWLVHCTFWQSCSYVKNTPTIDLAIVENRSGTLNVVNSILWDDENTSLFGLGGIAGITVTNSVIQGAPLGSNGTSPALTPAGSLRSTSAACLNKVAATWVLYDIHLNSRNIVGTGAEIGAEEWYDSDSDGMPFWWEAFWFGAQTQTAAGNHDGDAITNINEYLGSTRPAADQDGDGLADEWEITYFGSITAQNGTGNPDGDARNNEQEETTGNNPNYIDSDYDGDGDGLKDAWEITHFGNITAQNGTGNPDGDGRNNEQEETTGNNPMQIDSDYDGDGDGLKDVWEIQFFGNTTSQNGTGNPDGDGRNNEQEETTGNNPMQIDSDYDGDGDGLKDRWEIQYFGNITDQNGTGNPDGDGRNNLQEQAAYTIPTQIDWDYDGDGDGLKDRWEILHFGNTTDQNGTGNPDGDDENNEVEETFGGNPNEPDDYWDGDDDGMPYFWEVLHSLDPYADDSALDPDDDEYTNLEEYDRQVLFAIDSNPNLYESDWDGDGLNDQDEREYFGDATSQDGNDDFDSDGLTNHQEMNVYGTEPDNPYTANLGAGFTDLFMIQMGFSFDGDTDGDGVSDVDEAEQGTNPFLTDTDKDGVADNLDALPLDPNHSSPPAGVSGAPIIQLTRPAGIILVP